MGRFFAILVIVGAAIFYFASDKLPPGVGLKSLHVRVNTRPSVATLFNGSVAMIENISDETYRNVELVCRNPNGKNKTIKVDVWRPGETDEIGTFQGWVFENGETLTINVPGYLPYATTFH